MRNRCQRDAKKEPPKRKAAFFMFDNDYFFGRYDCGRKYP